MRLRLSEWTERLRSSLFFVPMLGIVVAIVAGLTGLAVDRRLDPSRDLPLGMTSTVDSARAVLSTIAGATIAFAGIAFSVSLLIIQQASSQYSPRVMHTLFRDPFNRRVMGLVLGTFTYCVIVLRSVRSPFEESGEPVIPNLSVAVAVVLGIATILAIVAFINHSAHTMDVSEILERVRRDAVDQIRREWSPAEPGHPRPQLEEAPAGAGLEINFHSSGWVQDIDLDAVLRALPNDTDLRLETYPGRYAIEGTALASMWPRPSEPDEVERAVREALVLGPTRTMQHDVSYGLRQLADVALKALSPGIHDPTTAQDAIFHIAAVLTELLHRDPPPFVRDGVDGARIVVAQQPTHDDLVRLAFDETRRAAVAQPTVCIYLLEALHLISEALHSAGLSDRCGPLVEQARLIAKGASMSADLLAEDIESVQVAHAKRFSVEPRS
ncbi:MAG: DUF2254 domain-containing protein [Acidimicrobiales bacterium]